MFQDEHNLIGQVLRNRYEIQGKIDSGAMGVVYHAWDQIDNRPLAVKVLPPREAWQINTHTYELLFERFTRERNILVNLRHQYIVPLYDAGQYDRRMYFVMQYCSGGSLYQKLQKTEKTSFTEILQYIRQAASALDYMHSKDIVHRDIKPQNFLLNGAGDLLLTDFGIAYIVGSRLTAPGQVWGTGVYASPEAKRSEEPDSRDDIYSLGVVLYELVTRNDPRMLHKLRQGIPPQVDKVIDKATASQRKDRYTFASAMAEDLARAIRAEGLDVEKIASSPLHTTTVPDPSSHRQQIPHQQTTIGNRGPLFQSIPLLNRLSPLASILTILLSLVLVSVIIIIFANLFMGNTSPPTSISFFYPPADSPTPSPLVIGKETVQQYYMYWNSRNYQAAYNLLQMNYQQKYPFKTLLADYEHTQYACTTIDDTTSLNNVSIQVSITDNAIEDAPSGQGTVINRYRVVYIVSQEQNTWKLAPEQITLESTHGTCNAPSTITSEPNL